MQLDQRDLQIIQLVSRFGQLSSKQIQLLVFSHLSSHTPAHRTLTRLLERRYLARIEQQRIVGGSRGGSGQYVYQLGPEGHRLCREGRWIPARAVKYHSLCIGDTYVALHRLQQQRALTIRGFTTEPDSHVTIGRHVLKPDLYAELERPGGQTSIRIMFEIDMGTQGQRQITEKFVRYWDAQQDAEPAEWPENQIVVFIAIDEQRADELRWLLDKGKPEQRELFKVHTLATFEQSLS